MWKPALRPGVKEKFRSNQTSALSTKETNLIKLKHELMIRQIELEMRSKELKQERNRAENAVQKYIALYDYAPTGYLSLTQEGIICNINLSAAKIFDKERYLLINSEFKSFISQESRKIFDDFLLGVFRRTDETSCEVMLVINDEEVYVYIEGTLPVSDSECFLSMVDITACKVTEMELVKAKARAEENDKLKSAFLANMSHEIRTPMNAIIGFSELLAKRELTISQREYFSSLIRQRTYDLLRILDDILDISKIEVGQLKIEESDFLLSGLMKELYEYYLRRKTKEKDKSEISIKLKVDQKLENVFIKTDNSRLKQILNNLLSNAMKFTFKGVIEFGCNIDRSDALHFFVKDTGIGIPLSKQEMIFHPFQQVDDNTTIRQFSGTGLGLSISKGIVALLNGKIWVESVPSEGSTFHFTIPLISISHDVKKKEKKKAVYNSY